MTLGAAVVGLGVGEAHARAYAQLPECRLRWVYDIDPSRAHDVSTRLGGVPVARTLGEILSDPEVDVVSIASYDDAHFSQVVETLDAGKHAFVEKPLCRTLEELKAVSAACSRSARQLESNLVLRSAPLYRWLKSVVDDGRLGTIYAFDGDYLYGRLQKITEGWRCNVDDYSVMEGGGIHLIDLMLWITGERPTRAMAVGNRVCTSGTRFRYADYQAATFQFPSTLVGRITANFGCVHRHQHVVRVFGTEATFISDDQGARLHTSRHGTIERIDLDPVPATKGDLIPAFVEGIVRAADRRVVTQHEFSVISACVAAECAARQGGTVEVEYV